MSNVHRDLLTAAAGNAGEAVFVDDVFSTYLYTGTNATQAVANGLDLAGEGGLVWTKNRDNNANEINHQLMDSTSGYQYILESDTTNAVFDFGAGILTPTSTGFDLSSASRVNQSGSDYVSWTFRKQPGFFDVVTYTGDGTSNRNISHNLGSTPGCILIKNLSLTTAWVVYHRSLGGPQYYLELNTTGSRQTDGDQFSSTAPTDSVFTVGPNSGVNRSGDSYVAYLFAHDAQDFGTDSDEAIIKCGSYGPGTETLDGPEVNLGFEPQWVLTKCYDNTGDWVLHDNMRGVATNGNDEWLRPNTSGAEITSENIIFTSTGFKITSTYAYVNQSGYNYIYMAIRRPNKPAEEFAATDLFDIFTYKDNTLDQSTNPIELTAERQTGGPSVLTDMWWHALRGTTYPAGKSNSFFINSRLQGHGKGMVSDGAGAEPQGDAGEMKGYDRQTGVEVGPNGTFYYSSGAAGSRDHLSYYFRRAPGFFDAVAYTGNSVNGRALPHNLGVAPEMIIAKNRSNPNNWVVWHSALNITTESLILNADTATGVPASATTGWFTQAATSTNIYPVNYQGINQSGYNYIAHLFATVPGISKVGSYSGTGSDVNVDCGFSSGARFVLIKRTDSTGDWYVWDTERGIVAGNDPYVLLNTTAAEVTSTDYIDPLSSGFTVTSSAPAALNASGGTYIFYAIA